MRFYHRYSSVTSVIMTIINIVFDNSGDLTRIGVVLVVGVDKHWGLGEGMSACVTSNSVIVTKAVIVWCRMDVLHDATVYCEHCLM